MLLLLHCCCLQIKNARTQLAQRLREVRARVRVIISGKGEGKAAGMLFVLAVQAAAARRLGVVCCLSAAAVQAAAGTVCNGSAGTRQHEGPMHSVCFSCLQPPPPLLLLSLLPPLLFPLCRHPCSEQPWGASRPDGVCHPWAAGVSQGLQGSL